MRSKKVELTGDVGFETFDVNCHIGWNDPAVTVTTRIITCLVGNPYI